MTRSSPASKLEGASIEAVPPVIEMFRAYIRAALGFSRMKLPSSSLNVDNAVFANKILALESGDPPSSIIFPDQDCANVTLIRKINDKIRAIIILIIANY